MSASTSLIAVLVFIGSDIFCYVLLGFISQWIGDDTLTGVEGRKNRSVLSNLMAFVILLIYLVFSQVIAKG